MEKKIKNILILKMSSLGDVILAMSAAQATKEMDRRSFIGWLVERRNYGVLEGNPFVDKVFIWDKTIEGFIKILKEIRRNKWDICLDLQGLFKSATFCFLSGAKKRFGLEKVERGSHILYTDLLPSFHFLHAFENYLLSAYVVYFQEDNLQGEVLKKGISWVRERANNLKPTIYLTEAERAKAGEILKDERRLVALCPGTTWASKQWPAEKWAKVGDSLVEMGFKIIFLGAKQDIQIANEIKRLMKRSCLDLTGKTTIREASAILERTRLAISVDSGAMHLATAVNTPVLALFGPTNPRVQGPYGREHKVIYKALNCSPCRKRNCPEKSCMEMIVEEEVIGLTREILKREREGNM